MTTIFHRLFRFHKNIPQPENNIPEGKLFAASEQPAPEPSHAGSIVKQFLHHDHYSAGRTAGYQTHNQDDLAFQKDCLKSKFQHILSSLQERMEDELLDKKQKLIQIGGLLPTQRQLIELEIKDIHDKMEKMNIEKALSVDEEGWISSALNDFERGYKKGLQDFISEKSFLTRHII